MTRRPSLCRQFAAWSQVHGFFDPERSSSLQMHGNKRSAILVALTGHLGGFLSGVNIPS